jgi:hypothetical protein
MRLLLLLCLASFPCALLAACPPASHDRAALVALKTTQFEVADGDRPALALALVDCLADADPALRDGVAYEALARWLQRGVLPRATRVALFDALLASLRSERDDAGLRRPFAALVLSELAASDRDPPWLDAGQRAALLDAATNYVDALRDYRGFEPGVGWRHGVAHGADLLLQLARHPGVDRAGLDRILAALATQVAPVSAHAYVDGESERLARAMLYVALRGEHDAAEWERWLVALAGPGPLASWDEAFASRAGLARRHNLLAFLRAAYEGAREAGDARLEAALLPGLRAAFKVVP